MPKRINTQGNEAADSLPRKGSTSPPTGTEPYFDVSKCQLTAGLRLLEDQHSATLCNKDRRKDSKHISLKISEGYVNAQNRNSS